jgi:hypothetical protein
MFCQEFFITNSRKPQPFKAGDEWNPFFLVLLAEQEILWHNLNDEAKEEILDRGTYEASSKVSFCLDTQISKKSVTWQNSRQAQKLVI